MDLQEIVETFAMIDDGEERYRYLIELGRDLEGLPEAAKVEDHRVHGCQSRVWMLASAEGGALQLRADSDAFIVRGLIAILLAIFDRKPLAEVAATDPKPTFAALGLDAHLSMGRRNGLYAMVQRVHKLAEVLAPGS
jgi:cysteine desulfuration protein SufE